MRHEHEQNEPDSDRGLFEVDVASLQVFIVSEGELLLSPAIDSTD